MLEIKNITKIFNAGTVNEKVALDGVSLTLNDGDLSLLSAATAPGKSTMLNAVAGTYFLDGGSISVDGADITRLPRA